MFEYFDEIEFSCRETRLKAQEIDNGQRKCPSKEGELTPSLGDCHEVTDPLIEVLGPLLHKTWRGITSHQAPIPVKGCSGTPPRKIGHASQSKAVDGQVRSDWLIMLSSTFDFSIVWCLVRKAAVTTIIQLLH